MAIVQISRITQRKGLQENLPQLAGAEFGWSIDERRLFIGNGTLQEGAPVIGNTEILTEFSDIFAFQTNYTYSGQNSAGYVAQTGPTAGSPISQSLQNWLDQFATVKDFGATGDGVTDDTAAINRALYQIYCREVNPQIRRGLFFPAGVYRVTESIVIPPFATLYGEGADNSIVQMSSGDDSALRAYVARTGDSLQQTGVNIGNNGAIVPQFVTIANMGFESLDPDVDVFLVEDINVCSFTGVTFSGPLVVADLDTDADDTAGIRFASTASLVCNTVTIDRCVFSGTTYGIATEQQTNGVTVSNSKFDTLFKGIALGITSPVNGGPTGTRIIHNLFDNIYAQGIEMGTISLNGTGHNIFYDVGNHFDGVLQPATTIIDIDGNNNVCIGDMFERGDAYVSSFPRININSQQVIATTNGKEIEIGTFRRESGFSEVLVGNTSGATTIASSTLEAFSLNYSVIRGTNKRTGVITVANDLIGNIVYTDDFNQTAATGVVLTVINNAGTADIKYTSTAGANGTFIYSIYSTL
jgi:Pectate lyase superfamily protein